MEERMVSAIQTQEGRSFDKETLKKEILSNLKVMFRKTRFFLGSPLRYNIS